VGPPGLTTHAAHPLWVVSLQVGRCVSEEIENASIRTGSRLPVGCDKRTEGSEIENGPCHYQLDGGHHGSEVVVSGSAMSVPRGESPTTGQRIASLISVAHVPKLPSVGT
jgi:hypothetical protein